MRQHHTNLVAEEIRRITADAQSASSTGDVMSYLIKYLNRNIKEKYKSGKKLKENELNALVDNFDQIISGTLHPIEVRYLTAKHSKLKSAPDTYESAYVGLRKMKCSASKDTLFQLYSFRLMASRKSVLIEYQPLPYALQYHAATRFIERVKKSGGPINNLGSELFRWLPAISEMYYRAGKASKSYISLPDEDQSGLMLGRFTDFYVDYTHGVGRLYSRDALRPFHINPPVTHPLFIVNTFVDKYVLSERQTVLMETLADWYKTNESDCETIAENIVWPYRLLDIYEGSDLRLNDASRAGINSIMKTKLLTDAMMPTILTRGIESDCAEINDAEIEYLSDDDLQSTRDVALSF